MQKLKRQFSFKILFAYNLMLLIKRKRKPRLKFNPGLALIGL